MTKLKALMHHVNSTRVEQTDDNTFTHDSQEFLVLTEEEAHEAVTDYIKESLWAFTPGFIGGHTRNGLSDRAMQGLMKAQEACCEGVNDLVEAMIVDMEVFVKDAVEADGRGHFLSPYDGLEHEVNGFFIYRMN